VDGEVWTSYQIHPLPETPTVNIWDTGCTEKTEEMRPSKRS